MKQKRSRGVAAASGPAILDSSAVLAYLRKEKGHEVVAARMPGAFLSTVNYCEVLTKTVELGGDGEMARNELDNMGVRRVEFTDAHAALAASLRQKTRSLGLSLGDRACLALGILEAGVVVTADKAWSNDLIGVPVHQIR